uniref:Uncharacterized protein n=1 Tax=Eutreptiella gymnastica TaxID=73025 RepID=A0A7S1I7I1_9EUGL|mmetsp:Transcript_136309/g.236500  ORF Transcript_136309/g.236500 Transcript_136309/m.236500 type:complete len:120 (+) Transcript_136309:179-538(+)
MAGGWAVAKFSQGPGGGENDQPNPLCSQVQRTPDANLSPTKPLTSGGACDQGHIDLKSIVCWLIIIPDFFIASTHMDQNVHEQTKTLSAELPETRQISRTCGDRGLQSLNPAPSTHSTG